MESWDDPHFRRQNSCPSGLTKEAGMRFSTYKHGNQPLVGGETPERCEVEAYQVYTVEDIVVMRGDNLNIVDMSNFQTQKRQCPL